MSEPKFKVGDKARVVGNSNKHGFALKQKVEIMRHQPTDNAYLCFADEGVYHWCWVWESDLEPLSPIEEQTNLVAEGSIGQADGNSNQSSPCHSLQVPSNSIGQDFPKCTLTNEELILRSHEWITKLCKSGGKAWSLRVPVDVDRDPDCLFSELCDRLSKQLPVQECDASKADSTTVRPDNNSEKTMTSKDHSSLKEGEEDYIFYYKRLESNLIVGVTEIEPDEHRKGWIRGKVVAVGNDEKAYEGADYSISADFVFNGGRFDYGKSLLKLSIKS